MNCRETEKYLPLYPDDVEKDIRDKIAEHLGQCNKCKDLAERLTIYSSYIGSAEEPEVPGGLESGILKEIKGSTRSTRMKFDIVRIGIALGAVASLLIILLVFNPFRKPWKDATETHFAFMTEKKGKGPPPSADIKKINEKISEIITTTGSTIEKKHQNAVTGYYDYMIIGIPGASLISFTEKYNQASSYLVEFPASEEMHAEKVYLKVYFDMISFTTGNFDGDYHADLIIRFISGKYKGKWFIYTNNDSGHFERGQAVSIGGNEERYLRDNRMISGDYNRDGFDDICLYEYSNKQGLSVQFLLNDHHCNFHPAPATFMNLSVPEDDSFADIVSGDADGNGIDELWQIAPAGNETYIITDITHGHSFKDIRAPDVDGSGGIFIAGDFNGDKFTDICVKYLHGKMGARTEVYFNNHDFSFSEPVSLGLSFFGDFIIWADDYNADGFDDLFVKSERRFFQGDWYVMLNNNEEKFTTELVFRTHYP